MKGIMPDFYCDQILTGASKVEVLEESPHILAFKHTQPYWPVHIVVIPKTHIESIDVLSSEHERMVLDAMRIISGLAAKVRAEHGGCRVSTNVGEYQSTRHLHWYIHSGRRIRDEAGQEID
jgi:histidine triad (HIT) family protein